MFEQLEQSRWSGFGGVWNSRLRWWAILAYCVYGITFVAWAGMLLLIVVDPDGGLFIQVSIAALISTPCGLGALLLHRYWSRINEPSGPELLEGDHRKIVLYLRSFPADQKRFQTPEFGDSMYAGDVTEFFQKVILRGSWRRGEEFLAGPLSSLGPVVAIGRPGERVPPQGAIRLYPQGDWTRLFTDLLNRARIVVVVAGTSRGLRWEIEQVFSHASFVPVMLLTPYFQGLNTEGALRKRRAAADRFREMFRSVTGVAIPEGLEYCRLVYFRERANPEMIFDSREDSERKLNMANPFLGPLARVIDETYPQWSAPYLEQTRNLQPSGGARNILGQGFALVILIFLAGTCVLTLLMYFAPQVLVPLFR